MLSPYAPQIRQLAAAASAVVMSCLCSWSTAQPAQLPPVPTTTLVYQGGANWQKDLPPEKQKLSEHFAYMAERFKQKKLLAYGPTLDDGRGFYVVRETDATSLKQIVSNDPAVLSGVLTLVESTPWLLMVNQLDTKKNDQARFFILAYLPGANWVAGKTMSQQALAPHLEHVGAAARTGELVAGGPVSDTEGRYIVAVQDQAAADRFVSTDPGVKSGIFAVKVRPWQPFMLQSGQ